MQTIIDMSSGKIPMDKESIKYIDPKKIKVVVESSSSSGDEWQDPDLKKTISRPKKRVRNDSSDDYSKENDSA